MTLAVGWAVKPQHTKSNKSIQKNSAKSVKSKAIYVSNGTQRNIKTRQRREKKARWRRKRGPWRVANSIESSREASQCKLANAVGDEGVTSDGKGAAEYEKRKPGDRQEARKHEAIQGRKHQRIESGEHPSASLSIGPPQSGGGVMALMLINIHLIIVNGLSEGFPR